MEASGAEQLEAGSPRRAEPASPRRHSPRRHSPWGFAKALGVRDHEARFVPYDPWLEAPPWELAGLAALSAAGEPAAAFDVVLCADLLLPYAPQLFEPLCETLRLLLCSEHSEASSCGERPVALFAYEQRFDVAQFFELCAAAGLVVDEVPRAHQHPKFQAPEIHSLRIAAALLPPLPMRAQSGMCR